MNRPYDLPPFLKGSEQEQIIQLKDYLTKLVMDMNNKEKEKKSD